MAGFAGRLGTCAIFGRTGFDVCASGALVAVVSAHPGLAELPDPEGGEPTRVRVTDELVRGMLLQVYADSPNQVAEAVMALRRLAPEKAAWLERLMRNAPGLQDLHRAVRRELTGVES